MYKPSGSPLPGSPLSRPASPLTPKHAGWKLMFNKMEGECKWPLPPPLKGEQDCAFPFSSVALLDDAVSRVTLPAGAKLYHATTIYPKDARAPWFTSATPFATVPGKAMWFASSAIHAKHMNYTHVLEYTLTKDIDLLFVQNIATTFGRYGVSTGKDLLRTPEFHKYLTPEIVGYAGCNECEIAILKTHLLTNDFLSAPLVLEERGLKFITGGGRHRKTQRQRRSKPKKLKTVRKH